MPRKWKSRPKLQVPLMRNGRRDGQRRGCYFIREPHYTSGEIYGAAKARKIMAQHVREDLKECRRRYDRCTQVGTVKEGSVKIVIGGKQGYHMYNHHSLSKC